MTGEGADGTKRVSNGRRESVLWKSFLQWRLVSVRKMGKKESTHESVGFDEGEVISEEWVGAKIVLIGSGGSRFTTPSNKRFTVLPATKKERTHVLRCSTEGSGRLCDVILEPTWSESEFYF